MDSKRLLKYVCFVSALVLGICLTNAVYSFLFAPLEFSGVKIVLQNTQTYQIKDPLRCKPNPLVLVIDADGNRNLRLNRVRFGNIKDLSEMKKELMHVFELRNKQGLFDEKEITIIPNEIIRGKKLVDFVEMLEDIGANPILIDWEQKLVTMEVDFVNKQ